MSAKLPRKQYRSCTAQEDGGEGAERRWILTMELRTPVPRVWRAEGGGWWCLGVSAAAESVAAGFDFLALKHGYQATLSEGRPGHSQPHSPVNGRRTPNEKRSTLVVVCMGSKRVSGAAEKGRIFRSVCCICTHREVEFLSKIDLRS